MLDLDAGAARIVAGSPKEPKRLARLEAFFLREHQLRQENGQLQNTQLKLLPMVMSWFL